MKVSQASKYDMRLNPVYQVDWQNAASGKRVSGTKRRVRWKFGFSNAAAIAQGQTGTECRGEEHEVSLVWSLASGKRLVVADGQEVHFSFGKRTDTKFETSWTMNGGHMIKLIAYAAPPLFLTPGFKQFDLLLDGCSYFSMPKIYELGTPKMNKLAAVERGMVPHRSPTPAYNNFALPPTSREEHHAESRRRDTAPATPPPRHLDPPSAPVVDLVSEPMTITDGKDLFDTPSSMSTGQQPAVVVDEFSPVPAPPPTFDSVSNQILNAYGPDPSSSTSVPALANEPHTYGYQTPQKQEQQQYQAQTQQQPSYNQPAYPNQQQAYGSYEQQQQQVYYQQQQQVYYQQQQEVYYQQPVPVSPDSSEASATPMDSSSHSSSLSTTEAPTVVTPTMDPINLQELEQRGQPPVSAMEKAIKSLVNLDIDEVMETPEQIKSKEKKLLNQPHKSKALPPTQGEWHLGKNPALRDLKEHATPKKEPTREIMRTHAFDPAAGGAGMMVVYGATTMPQQQGFGYAAQQQQQYAQQQQQQPQGYYGYQQPMMAPAYY